MRGGRRRLVGSATDLGRDAILLGFCGFGCGERGAVLFVVAKNLVDERRIEPATNGGMLHAIRIAPNETDI